jgi:hypothetical protein
MYYFFSTLSLVWGLLFIAIGQPHCIFTVTDLIIPFNIKFTDIKRLSSYKKKECMYYLKQFFSHTDYFEIRLIQKSEMGTECLPRRCLYHQLSRAYCWNAKLRDACRVPLAAAFFTGIVTRDTLITLRHLTNRKKETYYNDKALDRRTAKLQFRSGTRKPLFRVN